MTLLEVMIALAVLLVAVTIFSTTVVATLRQKRITHEKSIAAEAARSVLEELMGLPFEDLFYLYNSYDVDDPGGPTTAPGATFAVEGLSPLPGALPEEVGSIMIPEYDPVRGTAGVPPASGSGTGSTGTGGGLEPESGSATGPSPSLAFELREDLQLTQLDLPRDLNGDGLVDSEDHAQDYLMLPVRVRIEWQGPAGPLEYELHTILTDYNIGSVAH